VTVVCHEYFFVEFYANFAINLVTKLSNMRFFYSVWLGCLWCVASECVKNVKF
jgi:hypothetical protein